MGRKKIDAYLKTVQANVYTMMVKTQQEGSKGRPKAAKKAVGDFMPTRHNYKELLGYTVTVPYLKAVCKANRIKATGNKMAIMEQIMSHFHMTEAAVIVQKVWRGTMLRRLIALRGPAIKNRAMCINPCDFITMENIAEISPDAFFSYEAVKTVSRPSSRRTTIVDSDGEELTKPQQQELQEVIIKEVYGFNVGSLYKYVIKQRETKNPYTREAFPAQVVKNVDTFIRLSRIIMKGADLTTLDDIGLEFSPKQGLEMRALDLFQAINALDNYSDAAWFLALDHKGVLDFVRFLVDIWEYRAQILEDAKRIMVPPDGQLFRGLNYRQLSLNRNLVEVKHAVLAILERLIHSTADVVWRKLGAIYILAALTLVNYDAARHMPVYHNMFG